MVAAPAAALWWSAAVVALCAPGVSEAANYYAACQIWPQTITADNGVLLSPNYGVTPTGVPKTYPSPCHAATAIVASGTMQVIFETFNLAAGDTLRIVDQDVNLQYSQTFTGRALPFVSRRSSSIMITFDSEGNGNASTGFLMTWTTNFIIAPTPPASVLAGDTYTFNLSGAITQFIIRTPNYPNPYPNNANINWMVLAPPGQRVAFDLASFQTEPNADVLQVYDGDDPTTQVLVGRYSGNLASQLPLRILSDSSRLQVKFLTDASTQMQGFYGRCTVYYDGLALFTIAPSPTAQGSGGGGGAAGGSGTPGPAQNLSAPDTTTTVLIAFFVPILVLAAVGVTVTYLMWYKPRKLRRMRENADKQYQLTERSGETTNGRPGTARPGTARPGTARPGTARPGTARPGTARPGTAAARGGQARPTTARPTTARPGTANPERTRSGAAAARAVGEDAASAAQPSAVALLELPAAIAGAVLRPTAAGPRPGEPPRTAANVNVIVTRTEYGAVDAGLAPPGAILQLVAPTLSSRTSRKLIDSRDKFVGETIDDSLSTVDVRSAAQEPANGAEAEGLAGTLRDLLLNDGGVGESERVKIKKKKKKAAQQQQTELPPLAGGIPKTLPPIRAPAERSLLAPLDELPYEPPYEPPAASPAAGRVASLADGRGRGSDGPATAAAAAAFPEPLPALKVPPKQQPQDSFGSAAAVTNQAYSKAADDPTENDSDSDW